MYQFGWLPGNLVQPEQLEEFAAFYSNHYGVWSDQAPSPKKPGDRVTLKGKHLRPWFTPDSIVVWATALGQLVGYAIAIQTVLPKRGAVAWVTQLVVHHDHRNKDVGKALLFSRWGFTDCFAWGVLSANPYAVRALEKATRRRCQPVKIKVHAKELLRLGQKHVPYVKDSAVLVTTDNETRINTEFFVDHSELETMLANVSTEEKPWQLGPLPEGWEWFAFTFRMQPQIRLSQAELDEMLDASDQVTREAYSRMPMDAISQKWAKFHKAEAQFIADTCGLPSGSSVLDFGCGTGRHSFELATLGFNVHGVDYVALSIDKAAEKAKAEHLPATFTAADC